MLSPGLGFRWPSYVARRSDGGSVGERRPVLDEKEGLCPQTCGPPPVACNGLCLGARKVTGISFMVFNAPVSPPEIANRHFKSNASKMELLGPVLH